MTGITQAKTPSAGWKAPFFTIWAGQALSLVGSGMGGFALVWWLTETTGSATVLAMATLVQLLPGVILGPFVGALVDRWNRRAVMLVADSVIALFSAWLAMLFWLDAMQLWHVYVIMFVRALGGAFHWPAMQASTSLMVPKEQLSRVAGMNQTLHGALNIVSPPLGAFLMGILPLHWIMAIDVITAGFAIAPLFFVHIPQPRRAQPAAMPGVRPSLWREVKEGFLYIYHWPGLFLILMMATVLNLLINPGMSLLPILVTRHFGGGALQLGWLNTAWGVGVVLGGLTLSTWGGFKRRMHTSLLGLLGMGVGFLLLGLVPVNAYWLALVALFLAGFMNPITNGPVFAMLQDIVAPEIQGRVFTVTASLSGAASPLGMVIAGPVADRFGPQIWLIVGGAFDLLMGGSIPFIPAIMNLEDHKQPVDERGEEAPAVEPAAG